MGYGTGAIMAVPCGDQRDFEFARQFALGIRRHPTAAGVVVRATPRSSATPSTALDTGLWPEAFVGDAPYVNSSNDTLDLNGIDERRRGHRHDQRVARGQRRRARPPSPTSCATGCSAGSATGANPSRSCTTSTAIRTRCPTTMLPVELPDTDSFSPRTFDPDDADSNPESPLDRLRRVGERHARPRRGRAAIPP